MSEWISVKDRLPPKMNGDYLITNGEKVRVSEFIHWMGEKDEQKSWTWILPVGWKKITHWMPLPKLPE